PGAAGARPLPTEPERRTALVGVAATRGVRTGRSQPPLAHLRAPALRAARPARARARLPRGDRDGPARRLVCASRGGATLQGARRAALPLHPRQRPPRT